MNSVKGLREVVEFASGVWSRAQYALPQTASESVSMLIPGFSVPANDVFGTEGDLQPTAAVQGVQ